MSTQTSMPPCPAEPNNSYVSRLRLNSGGAAGPLTVMTGAGLENSCTFHMATAPTPSATTATNGIQTRATTVLPTERGLTRSPFGTGPGPRTRLGHISTRLIYDRADTTTPGPEREHEVCGQYHLPMRSTTRTSQPSTHRESTKPRYHE